jgi:hypothetical protein
VHADHLLGIALAGQREGIERGHRQMTEYVLPLLHFKEARVGEADPDEILLFVRRAQPDQAIRFGKGERFQEHRIDDAEQRDVRADPEREAQDRNDSEPG